MFPVPYFSISFSFYFDNEIYLVVITTPQWLTYLYISIRKGKPHALVLITE